MMISIIPAEFSGAYLSCGPFEGRYWVETTPRGVADLEVQIRVQLPMVQEMLADDLFDLSVPYR
ncbi:hypothetical protein [Microvirga vignae]|nr:hypothetical protein [Microvirga vignae]